MTVDVLDKGTHQTYPGGIPHVLKGAVRSNGETLLRQFRFHALRTFDPHLKRSNRVTLPLADLISADHVEAGEKFLNHAL